MGIEFHKVNGPALLLSGPGTGKTYQLARRIKYLVEETGADPNTVTVITFTRHAARSMRAKISDPTMPECFVNPSQQPRMICTMHSLGHSILRLLLLWRARQPSHLQHEHP